ncbi:MAG: ABC transporter permease [Micrococcales bacterium]|nr:ABC transporter permease [Micrococcales bacterium]
MTAVLSLTGRNLRIFFRDRAGVFFSLLSALILIALYALFLGNLQVENLHDQLPGATDSDVAWFVNAWVFAGVTMITTLTTALAALTVFVDDKASGRFVDFIVSPVRRTQLVFGYLLASFVISMVMTLIVSTAGQLYLLIQGNKVMGLEQMARAVGYVALSSAAFAALASFAVTYLRTSGAFAAMSTVVGTVIGFLAGAYIPAGALPQGVVNVISALPFAQSAMLIRGPYTAQAVEALTSGPGQEQATETVNSFYGITMKVDGFDVTVGLAVLALLAVFVTFSLLGAWRLSRKIR